MYRLLYKKAAVKAMARMPKRVRERMQAELKAIARAPRRPRQNWKPLTGSPYWRLRVGDYRAICEIRDEELLVLVLKTGPRGDIYKYK